ncbi:MAG: cytochrome C, partial [Gemmatimonadetes bacterium]|nr:cytochrome C [Gemmatimonadota bacterium]
MSRTAWSVADRGRGPYLLRFGRVHRLSHILVMFSFLGLAFTGMPLHFAEQGWARVLMMLIGGPEAAGFIHRVCAIITFGYFGAHLGYVTWLFFTTDQRWSLFWGPESMVPQPKDVRDVLGMLRWFVRGGEKPRFDRYSYLEKFDYLAVFWGMAIIGGSGLLLWFPELFGRFLPGWIFNVATIVHGDEAILATGFIFTVHFFNTHLRPGKFPIDTVIFTGKATTEYMQEEHPLEYERLRAQGRLSQLETHPPSDLARLLSTVVGYSVIALGLIFLALLIW